MTDQDASITRRLYISHALSAWNSRTFEFGAVLFLATIFPGTLLYASIYALLRSGAAFLFSSPLGLYLDRTNRLTSIRHSIVWQRVSVGLSCALLWILVHLEHKDGVFGILCFAAATALACAEKLAAIGNTVAVERDWVVVICDNTNVDRGTLNASLRRIDLFCKLVAPVFISFVDAFVGTQWAIGVVFQMTALSIGTEYWAIRVVYDGIPALASKPPRETADDLDLTGMETEDSQRRLTLRQRVREGIDPWVRYARSPVLLASFSLSLLYLTVLSTNAHWQTYMLSTGHTALAVSGYRVAAVVSELSATCVAPILMSRIGSIRAGLWSINWQVVSLAAGVGLFSYLYPNHAMAAGAMLTAGMVISRLGLWGFDLGVQSIVQDGAPADERALVSSCEVALQNLFELLSFAATIVFPDPEGFVYPVLVSFGAVCLAAVCYAGYVRKERGHLLHRSKCLGGDWDRKKRYVAVREAEEVELGTP